VTRGKKWVVVVGSRKALAMAIRNVRVEKRNTGLREELAGTENDSGTDFLN
jgi:exodeoxyribonuclease V alpha subunit